jgi:hypothetical protein
LFNGLDTALSQVGITGRLWKRLASRIPGEDLFAKQRLRLNPELGMDDILHYTGGLATNKNNFFAQGEEFQSY